MLVKRRSGDLCTSYRPQKFSEVVGQQSIVKGLKNALSSANHAQCYLFMGERGCGKTTLARIAGMALNCERPDENGDPCCECPQCVAIASENHTDFQEINASSKNSVNDIRRIEQDLRSSPLFGRVKIYLFDEAHRLTKEAQNALLKDTEDMPEGVYVFMCSTEPGSIIKTLKDRCEQYKFKLLKKDEITDLINMVGVLEDFYPSEKITNILAQESAGRPRNALKLLQQAVNISKDSNASEEEILSLLNVVDDTDKEIIDLCRVITSNKRVPWELVVNTYKKVKAEPETIRMVLSGWFRSILEKSVRDIERAKRAAHCLSFLLEPLPVYKPENGLVLTLFKIYATFQMGDLSWVRNTNV